MSERSGGIIGAALLAALASAATWAAAPAALTGYVLDPAKSSLEFTFVQAGAQNKGKFTRFAVTLDFAPDNLEASRLEVTVEVSSLDTGDKERDDTLRGPDLFDLAKFPQARFSATRINKTASGYEAVGKLTIRGVARETRVPFTFRTADEQGHPAGYLTGKTTLTRLDFGVAQGDWQSTEWVGNDVTVAYSLRLTPATH